MEEPSRTADEGPPPRAQISPGEAAAGNERTESWGPRQGVGAARAFVRAALGRIGGPVARGAIVSIILTAVGTALSYGVQIFISRTLGVREYGKYAYVLGIMNVAALIAALDLGGAALRYVGFYSASGQWSLLRG